MKFTREQKKEAYKKLSPEIQDFIMSEETTDLISKILTETGFSEEQSDAADSEILCAMYGLQTLSEAMLNIANLSNKHVDQLSGLKENLQEKIFSKIPEAQINENDKKERVTTNKVGESFEQAILNQAKAMQPARIASGSVADGPARPANESHLPENLPAEPEPRKEVHNYPTGGDPYREPLG